MIQTAEIKGIIARQRLSQKDVALKIGITPKIFYTKMKSGVFDSNEMYALIEISI